MKNECLDILSQVVADPNGWLSKREAESLLVQAIKVAMKNDINVRFSKLHPDAISPKYAKAGDAGIDLHAISMEYIRTDLTDFYEYKTGIAVEIPEGFVGLLFPRSSITKTDLFLSNCVGVIDSGYRGEISARFRKTTGSPNTYKVGERICQLIVLPYPKVSLIEVPYEQLTKTERGSGGFGSSGK